MIPDYDDSLSLRDARALYFEANGFGEDGGYNDKWVTGKFGPLPFAFPNGEARRRVVPLHDLHHVITGYGTDGAGEGAISAWEVAGGCGRSGVAWFLNLNALFLGSLIDARGVFGAFVRGRRSRNFYEQGFDEELLARNLGDVRRELLAESETPFGAAVTFADRGVFAGWWGIGFALAVMELALVFAPVVRLVQWIAA